jgi:DNA-binding response OmpR family regulator
MSSVLIIEDDLELLRHLAASFLAAGHKTFMAPDGEAGLAKLDAEAIDLVVTDIIMPVREGVETIIAVKARFPAVKVIAISGGYRIGPDDFLHLARQLGADLTLAKPFRPSALVAEAERLLGLSDDPRPAAAA